MSCCVRGVEVPSLYSTYLLSSQGCLVQAMAPLSREASEATVALWNIRQAKFHSSTPPWAMALQ